MKCIRFCVSMVILGLAAATQAGCSLFPLPDEAENPVANGSFEESGQPTLARWQFFTCNDPDDYESHRDAPPGHGTWSLKLISGSTQGCFSRLAYQVVPEARDGEIWRLSAWAKQEYPDNAAAKASIYWKSLPFSPRVNRPVTFDTTSSARWQRLTVIDTLDVEEGDSVAVVLDPGITGGPLFNQSYFDGVTAEKIGEVTTSP